MGPLAQLTGTVRNVNGVVVSGALVQAVGVSGVGTVTTNGAGQYTFNVPAATDLFVRFSASTYKTAQFGQYLTDAGTLDVNLIPSTLFGQVAAQLGLTPNPDAGIVNVDFFAPMLLDGGFGASITLAHQRTFTFTGAGMPYFSDAGTADMGGGTSLIFPNVATGTTAVTPHPPAGYTCTVRRPDMKRVDPDTFTFVRVDCQ